MSRRKIHERNVRKIGKRDNSYTVTLPIEFIRELKWREKQRVVVTKQGKKLIIEDYKP